MGYRFVDKYGYEPRFPFGYGLSYTTFECEGGTVDAESSAYNVTVKNTGNIAGKVSVLVYMKGKEDEPPKVLVGFDKVYLEPGESRTVKIDITDGVIEGRDYFAVI